VSVFVCACSAYQPAQPIGPHRSQPHPGPSPPLRTKQPRGLSVSCPSLCVRCTAVHCPPPAPPAAEDGTQTAHDAANRWLGEYVVAGAGGALVHGQSFASYGCAWRGVHGSSCRNNRAGLPVYVCLFQTYACSAIRDGSGRCKHSLQLSTIELQELYIPTCS